MKIIISRRIKLEKANRHGAFYAGLSERNGVGYIANPHRASESILPHQLKLWKINYALSQPT